MDSVEFYTKIQEVIDSPVRSFSIEEAREILLNAGIIDSNNEITEAFKGIVVKKES